MALEMVAEPAELLLDSLHVSSTRHPDDTVVETLVEHRKLQSRIASCPHFTFPLFPLGHQSHSLHSSLRYVACATLIMMVLCQPARKTDDAESNANRMAIC